MSDPSTTAAAAPDNAPSGPSLSLSGRIDIFPAMPLPEFGVAPAAAYAARAQGSAPASPANMIAIVAGEGLPIRSDILPNLLSYRHPSLLVYRDSGLVDWLPEGGSTGRRLQCLIYDRPPLPASGDGRLSTLYSTPQRPMDDEKLVALLRPLVTMLGDLAARGISHGRIHPGNIFVGPSGLSGGLLLSDMASLPSSYDMPAMFMPIERAQAQPEGRGPPHAGDDLFSLGALVLLLKLGTMPPASQLPPDDVMRLRLERGSFSTYLGEHGVKGSTSELLRGLLDDDPQRRWSIESLEMWFGGRKPGAAGNKLVTEDSKPRRPFSVGGDTNSSQTRRGVAWWMARKPLEGAATVENGTFMQWVERSIEVQPLTDRAKSMLDLRTVAAGARAATLPDHLSARAAMLLDPIGPIRYRGLSVLPGGFGTLLATTLIRGGDVQPLADILNAKLPSLWTDGQSENRADHLSISQSLERAQMHLERPNPGYGIERVLYELLPGQPCLSPLVANAAPRSVGELLAALENCGGGATPIDRHIAAFLVSRDRRIHEGLLTAFKSTENTEEIQTRRAIGTLTLLAEAQYRHGQPVLKNLAAWVLKMLEPGIKRFHFKETQAQLRQRLNSAAAQGNLSDMLTAIDDPVVLEQDSDGYEDARMMWQQAEEDIVALQEDIDQRSDVERRVGQPIASAISVILGIIAGAFAIVFSVWNAP